MLRDEGLAELLPACNTVILDEAHQLPETATLFFGEQVSAGAAGGARARRRSGRPHRRPRSARPARRRRRPRPGDPRSCASRSATAPASSPQSAALRRDGFPAALARACRRRSTALPTELGLFAERSEDLAAVARRAAELQAGLRRWCAGLGAGRPAPRRRRHRERRSPRRTGRRLDPLGRRDAAGLPAARVAAVGRGHLLAAGRGLRPRLDLHLGDAGGRRRLLALPARAGA